MKDLYSRLAEILEVDSVGAEDVLNKFDTWDSLGVLSFISMADEDYQVILTDKELKNAKTVKALEDLLVVRKE